MNRRDFVKWTLGGGLIAASLPLRVRGAGPGAAHKQAIKTIVRDVLENIRKNGFNPDPDINKGLGGLWINFRAGTNPLETNFTTAGVPYSTNKDGSKRHDELTDLRYLHNLWTCRAVFPEIPHALDLAMLGTYSRVADSKKAGGLANASDFRLRSRVGVGRTLAYFAGLDGEIGGSDTSVVYGVTGYLVGLGTRWGAGNAIALTSGVGIDRIGSIPLAAKIPVELSIALDLGRFVRSSGCGRRGSKARSFGGEARQSRSSTSSTRGSSSGSPSSTRIGRRPRAAAG